MDIHPVPTDDEAAAIASAIELSLRATPSALAPPEQSRWRFAGRWWTKPIPVRRDRPW